MNSGGRPWAPRYSPTGLGAAAAAAAAAADAVERVALLLQLGEDLLDRAAGHELHQDEVDEQDAEERGDDQQQPAEDVGAHQDARISGWRRRPSARRSAPCPPTRSSGAPVA